MQVVSSHRILVPTIIEYDDKLRHLIPSQVALEFGLSDFIFSLGDRHF